MPVGALQEAVLSIGQIEYAERFYVRVAGYEVVHRGRAHESQSAFWRLPVEPIDEVVLRCPGADYGYLRLMKFYNLPQQYIRSSGGLWHTGGYHSLTIGVQAGDVHRKFAEMRETGWVAQGDPYEYAAETDVPCEALMSGHDGVNIRLVEHRSPPDVAGFTEFSPVYSAVQVVNDYETSKRFYLDGLGFSAITETDIAQPEPGQNPFNLPYNLAPQIVAKLAVFQSPSGDGQSEIMQLVGATGEDFAAAATPPHRGLMLMRYTVSDLAAYHADIASRGVAVTSPPRPTTIAPYGEVSAMALRTPDGAWMEFIEFQSAWRDAL